MNDHYSQQVSAEQSGAGRSEFVFSNGLSLEFTSDQASRLAVDTPVNPPNRLTGESLRSVYGPTTATRRDGFSSNRESVRNAVTSASGIPHQPRYPDYVEYADRLRSYARWTLSSPDTQSLTAAGFFYTNSGDLVRCYQCGIGLKDFSAGDDPVKEHVRHSGNCPHLQQMLGPLRLSVLKRQLQLEVPEYSRHMQWNGHHNVDPITVTYRHPEYQTLQARLLSFGRWPSQTVQTPRQMAEAGLYYTVGVRTRPRDEDLPGAMSHMDLREPEITAVIDEHRSTCLEMGYQEADFNAAVLELRNRGRASPAIEDILDAIDTIKHRKQCDSALQAKPNETPLEENKRLKGIVICMACGKNNVNALFLPCTHHRMCMECAGPLVCCPICNKIIQQKVRTYLA